MRIKRSISFILLFTMMLASLAGIFSQEASASGASKPMGELVYTHFGYHDSWTTQWIGANDPSTTEGFRDERNINLTWDKGRPRSQQSSHITLSASAFNVSSAEEFKNQFSVVPLQPAELQNLGLTAEQATEFINKAITEVNGGIQGAAYADYYRKYVEQGVTNYSINNSGITLVGDELRIPVSYRLSPPTEWPWAENLTLKVGDVNTGLPTRAAEYKATGRSYTEFRNWVYQFYLMPESSIQHVWNNGYLADGVAGVRWYFPFSVVRVGQPGDLNVPDLSITVDNGGDITCEATVENSFTDNLKRVQFVWELETPAGTVVETEVRENLDILKDAQSFTTKHTLI